MTGRRLTALIKGLAGVSYGVSQPQSLDHHGKPLVNGAARARDAAHAGSEVAP